MVNTLECTQSPREHPWAMRLARKLTRVGSEGLWTEKVKIVKYHALRFSLQYNGYQDVDYNCFKTDVPCVHSASDLL